MIEKRERRAEERSHLLRFLDALPDSPRGSRVFGDRPDLVVHGLAGRIGIEHTQILRHHDSLGRPHPKAVESMESRCVDRARELFEARDGRSLFVYPYFDGRPIRKPDVDGIAQQLAAAVHEIVTTDPRPRRQVEGWAFNRVACNPLPEQVERLRVIDAQGESLWGIPRGSSIQVLDRDRIQAEIDVKDRRLAEYRRACDEIWLLLVSDGFSPATELRLPDDIEELRFTTGFDRVFYFNNFALTAIELAIE